MSLQDYEYKMQDTMDLNNGDSITISSALWKERGIVFSLIPEDIRQINTFQYSKGVTKASDMVDLTQFVTGVGIPNATVTEVFNNIDSNPQPEDYYTTDAYQVKKDLVLANIGWIWGDFESGGMFVFRDSTYNNNITIYLTNGFYSKESGGSTLYGYGLFYGGVYSDDQMKQVFFTFDAYGYREETVGYSTCLVMNYRLDPSSTSYGKADFVIDVGLDREYYKHVDDNGFKTYTDLNPAYTGTLLDQDAPEEVCWGNIQSRHFYNANWGSSYTNISGSWDGDAATESEDDPYSGGGTPETGGGNGYYPDRSDDDDTSDPSEMTVDGVTSGFIQLYNPSVSEMTSFNGFLFSGLSSSVIDTLKKLTTEPLQYIISVSLCHFQPQNLGISIPIKFGGVDTGVSAIQIHKQHQRIHCGYVDIPNASNSFMDYKGFSSCHIFLPYVGFRELSIDEVMGSRLKVDYIVDLLTGSFICQLHITRNKRWTQDAHLNHNMYEFAGNCFQPLPFSSLDQRGTVEAIATAVGALGSAAQGNAGGAISGLFQAAIMEKESIHRGGNAGSAPGYMSKQHPFVVLGRPINSTPANQGSFEGWTSNPYKRVSSLKGYTEVDPDTVWSNNIPCTDEEAQMIKDIMNGGVYL